MRELKRILLILLVATGAAFGAAPALRVSEAQAQRPCSRCNIVEEGLWNDRLINQTVYLYSRKSNRFFAVTITGVHREGPFYVVRWRDPSTGKEGKDDATNYYSYRSMQEMTSGASPPLSQSERQEKSGWLASCALARSDDAAMRLVGRQGCCHSTAAQRYGPDPICRW